MNSNFESDYKSADELEREVDAARDRVTETIGAIEDKLSPGQFIDRLLPLYRQSGAAATVEHYGKSLGHAAQANPLPFLLIGAGVAWMALTTSSRKTGEISSTGYADSNELGGDDESHSLGERIGEAAASVRASIHDATDTARDRVHSAKATVGAARQKSRQAADRMTAGAKELADRHPLLVGLAGFTIGTAIGAAFPSTETEDELVGEQSDKMKASAERIGKEQLDKAGDIVSAAVSAAKDVARDEGLSMHAGEQSARTLVDKIQHVGEAAIDAAVDETRTIDQRQNAPNLEN